MKTWSASPSDLKQKPTWCRLTGLLLLVEDSRGKTADEPVLDLFCLVGDLSARKQEVLGFLWKTGVCSGYFRKDSLGRTIVTKMWHWHWYHYHDMKSGMNFQKSFKRPLTPPSHFWRETNIAYFWKLCDVYAFWHSVKVKNVLYSLNNKLASLEDTIAISKSLKLSPTHWPTHLGESHSNSRSRHLGIARKGRGGGVSTLARMVWGVFFWRRSAPECPFECGTFKILK